MSTFSAESQKLSVPRYSSVCWGTSYLTGKHGVFARDRYID